MWVLIPSYGPGYVAFWTICPTIVGLESEKCFKPIQTHILGNKTIAATVKYQNIGRTSSLIRKTFVGRLQGKDLEILDSSIKPRPCKQ